MQREGDRIAVQSDEEPLHRRDGCRVDPTGSCMRYLVSDEHLVLVVRLLGTIPSPECRTRRGVFCGEVRSVWRWAVLVAAHRALINLVRRLPTRGVVALAVAAAAVYSHHRH